MATDLKDFQCVLVGEVWHLTQEQALPPNVLRDGAWTSCAVWATFKRGFNRRRPDCPECLKHVLKWEESRTPSLAPPVVTEAPIKLLPESLDDTPLPAWCLDISED